MIFFSSIIFKKKTKMRLETLCLNLNFWLQGERTTRINHDAHTPSKGA